MMFSVILLPQAERDLDQIIGWIKNRSPQGASTWFQRWLEVLELLERSPLNCGLAPEDEDHDQVIRQVLFKTRRGRPYRALFTIRSESVYVLHIRGPGQRRLRPSEFDNPS